MVGRSAVPRLLAPMEARVGVVDKRVKITVGANRFPGAPGDGQRDRVSGT